MFTPIHKTKPSVKQSRKSTVISSVIDSKSWGQFGDSREEKLYLFRRRYETKQIIKGSYLRHLRHSMPRFKKLEMQFVISRSRVRVSQSAPKRKPRNHKVAGFLVSSARDSYQSISTKRYLSLNTFFARLLIVAITVSRSFWPRRYAGSSSSTIIMIALSDRNIVSTVSSV